MEINDIVYGNPPKRYIDILKGIGADLFVKSKDVIDEFISKFPPPKNDSEETINEIKQLSSYKLSKEEKDLCEDLDKNAYRFFSKIAKKYFDVEVSEKELKNHANLHLGIITFIKMHFNRARPQQLAWYHKIKLFPNVVSGTANSASYPSGHTFEFLILLDYISKKNPKKAEMAKKIYSKIRNVRELSGLHYPSDTKGSEILFKMLKNKKVI